ncbi:MAPEG family protein [Pseudaestuariivita atlantica]|uniref:MAPEG family protein n=1 Tax=Pseudaestuariivita atlantica TaxID=1317121 RepID=A0A0L1JQN5_9RHOB|nr:MAPEG family protein [Pseudaestuariivita atlantica]KNG94099.1 hypothetical protein ATO11_07595 [Pseudaestuariivita atlantica]
MGKRGQILLGMAAGLLWAFGVVYVGGGVVQLPVFAVIPTILTAYLGPGLVCLLMVARLAQRRFFDDTIIDGEPLTGAAAIDQRVLTNTVEQAVLALCLWPAAAILLGNQGPGTILVLGVAFALARVAFWVGYHLSPPLRAFGFAATFYPTILVTLWALVATVETWL